MSAGSGCFSGKSSFGQRLLEGLQCTSFLCLIRHQCVKCDGELRKFGNCSQASSKELESGFVVCEPGTELSSQLYGRVWIFKDG